MQPYHSNVCWYISICENGIAYLHMLITVVSMLLDRPIHSQTACARAARRKAGRHPCVCTYGNSVRASPFRVQPISSHEPLTKGPTAAGTGSSAAGACYWRTWSCWTSEVPPHCGLASLGRPGLSLPTMAAIVGTAEVQRSSVGRCPHFS
jgi:hypothetical protein